MPDYATLMLRALFFSLLFIATAFAHPLGQQSINHFARIATDTDRVELHYVVDLAELPTYKETQAIDTDSNGQMTQAELNAYLARVAPSYLNNLVLTADGARVVLQPAHQTIELLTGEAGANSMGLATLRLTFDLTGKVMARGGTVRFRFEDNNQLEQAGWRELIVAPLGQTNIFNSTAYADSLTDRLRRYPPGPNVVPLNQRTAEWSATQGSLPPDARLLRTHDGQPVMAATSRLPISRLWFWSVGAIALLGALAWWLWRRNNARLKEKGR